jgi:ABC-2 type transport system ATP-binding protein
VHRPPVVFLDEPTAGVDVALRRDLWEYVRALRKQGTTIVLTTHYLEEAETLADRVAVIDHGRLICMDSPRALLARFGRRSLRVTLAAPLPVGAEAQFAPSLRSAQATVDDTRLVISCQVAPDALAPLLPALAALPVPVADLETLQPSLEQVFLQLTGANQP